MNPGEIAIDLDAMSEEAKHIVVDCTHGLEGFHLFEAIDIIE